MCNVGRVVEFNLDGYALARRLVHRVDDPAQEINVISPVGSALVEARPGDSIEVDAPGGKVAVNVVRVMDEAPTPVVA